MLRLQDCPTPWDILPDFCSVKGDRYGEQEKKTVVPSSFVGLH